MSQDKLAHGKAPAAKASQTPSKTMGELLLVVLAILLISVVFNFAQGLFSGVDVASVFLSIFSNLKMIATIISMIALIIIVYSFMRISELAAAESKKLGLELNWSSERKQKNERWERVEEYMTSLNASDWKIAILEADNILDDITLRMGYQGENLGERMKAIDASDFPYLEEAWQAHKMRNVIAHKGTDYKLTRSEAEQTINIYHRVFKDLGYL